MSKFREINEQELFPTEQLGPKVTGTVLFGQEEQQALDAAYITTNERIFMNVDMGERVYERIVGYHEVNEIDFQDSNLTMSFDIGTFVMKDVDKKDGETFLAYAEQQMNKHKK